MSACYCTGPRPGHVLCPCRERAENERRLQRFVYETFSQPTIQPLSRAGWSCPNCGKAHGPDVQTCPDAAREPAPTPEPSRREG